MKSLLKVLVAGKEGKAKGREETGFQERISGFQQQLFPLPLCLCLDLFVGQLKSCLKCQACGYRSTTFEVFCDLSLPIPKVGFQRIPGVDGTRVL
jgi:ubiquitin C-terminal hydrolase